MSQQKMHKKEFAQLKYFCLVILRTSPEQMPNITHALKRAKTGMNFTLPLKIAVDEAIEAFQYEEDAPESIKERIQGERHTAGQFTDFGWDIRNTSEAKFMKTPVLTAALANESTKVKLGPAQIRALLDNYSQLKGDGFTDCTEEVGELIGAGRSTIFRYLTQGVPEGAPVRIREQLELLYRAFVVLSEQDRATDDIYNRRPKK